MELAAQERVAALRERLRAPVASILESRLAALLDAVVLFGSQARGNARASSDTDLLLCLAPGVPLMRDLYSQWDEFAAACGGAIPRDLSPHFSRQPGSPEEAGSLWLEVALDGIVLWERTPAVSRFLSAVRDYVSAGGAVRRSTYGIPYWVGTHAKPESREGYIRRAQVRLKALDALYEAASWADVVRESQEAVELALKGVLRIAGVEAPRVHDVSEALLDNRDRIPAPVRERVERLADCSRVLRRDRELAFYGTEDLLPTAFYREQDAAAAREMARETVASVLPLPGGPA